MVAPRLRKRESTRYRRPRSVKAGGCLPLPYHPSLICGSYRDRLRADGVDVLPPSVWPEYIGSIEVTSCVMDILSQLQVGSCGSESSSQGLMIDREWEGQDYVQVNPYTLYRQVNGGRDNGSNIGDNLVAMRKTGILPMEFWGREHGWKKEPPKGWQKLANLFRVDEFYWIANWQEFGTALLCGDPITYGRRGHAILGTELLENFKIKYANSWGAEWGDDGFGIDNLKRDVDFRYGAFAVRSSVHSGDWRELARELGMAG